MSENKIGKRMVRWSVFLFYCFVVGAVFLLFPILFYKCPDILFGFDVLLCCVLIIPAVAFGDRLFGWLEKENREQRKKTRLEQEEKSRSVREDFCLPDHIETAFEHDRRIYRRQTIPAIAVGVFGLAVAYGTEVFFSFFKWDELLLTSVFLFGLALIVYAFFVACGKPFLGILHSIAPFLLFASVPLILETNHITTNNGVLLLAGAGGGIVLYSLFLLLTVFLPKKKEERIRRRYNAAFLLEHSEFERYQTLIREYIPDECYVFYGNRKKIQITVIHETCYIIVYANAVFETHNLRNVPVVFETYRELNREVLSDFLNCGTM